MTPDKDAIVQLGFEGLENVGNGYLIDKTSKMVYRLNELSKLKVTTPRKERNYRIVVGSQMQQ